MAHLHLPPRNKMVAFDFFGSGVPARVLCLEAGADQWVDVPAFVLAHLQHIVARGKTLFRMPLVDGRWHVFDFVRMLRYDEGEPGAPPNAAALAWYDEAGIAFFPPGKAHLQVQPSEALTVDELEAVNIVRRWTMDTAVFTRAESCLPGDVKLRIFRDKEREFGGTVKLGWYGASPADVEMAGKNLFRSPNWSLIGRHRAHGHGLHLSPLRFPHLSMAIAEADHSGEASVLLCRIVHGLPEAIHAGSDQWINTEHEPKSSGGVDYLPNPSWYIVWAEHMNVCIVPLCVVSFRKRPALPVLAPLISCIPVFLDDMEKLRREIKRFLPSSQLHDLDRCFDSDTRNHYNFSKCVSDLIGVDMFVGAVLKTLEL